MFKTARATHPYHHEPESDDSINGEADHSHWFVAVVSNPCRYKTRYALFRKFRDHILKDLSGNLLVVECAFGNRSHQVTGDMSWDQHDYKEVQVYNQTQLWQKENLMNIGMQRLPTSAKYITFVDADVHFTNPHIVTEIVHALQIHKVVQPFETCCDLGPKGEVLKVHRSFGWCHAQGLEYRAPWKSVRGYEEASARRGLQMFGVSSSFF